MTDETLRAEPGNPAARMARALDWTLGALLSLLIFFMMALTFVDVSGRTLFDAPVPGGYEITQIAMGMVCYLGLPVVCARREHLSIAIFDHLFRGAAKRVQQAAINAGLGAMTLVWAGEVWHQADNLAESGELLMFLRISTAPFVYLMSALTFLAAALLFALAWFVARGAAPPSSGPGGR